MSQSQVISFRASSHFLNWIEVQRKEGESASQAAMRILKTLSTEGGAALSTNLSTQSSEIVASTKLSTITPQSVDTQIAASLDPILQQLAEMEERLGKLRAAREGDDKSRAARIRRSES
jgi:hypothetical protein